MQTPKQQNKPWDRFYSTYYWTIHLDLNNPRNHAERLTGYSKKVNENEKADKDELLKTKILMLLQNGYLDRSTKIDFYFKTDFAIDKSKDPCILILMPNAYNIPPTNGEYMLKRFGVFLNEFYDRKKRGLAMTELIPKKKNATNLDDLFDVSKANFKTEAHLYGRAAQLLTYGHPPGQVNQYIDKVRTLKGWK